MKALLLIFVLLSSSLVTSCTFLSVQIKKKNLFDFSKSDAEFVMILQPRDNATSRNASGKVIQGIAAYNDSWVVSQDAGKREILFNIIDSTGVSQGNWKLPFNVHGQDLSILKTESGFNIYTGNLDKKAAGISVFQYDTATDKINFKEFYNLVPRYKLATPTLNTNKNKFALRARHDKNKFDSRIYIFDKVKIESGKTKLNNFFQLSELQKTTSQWFQGIVFDDKIIYVLSGNNKIHSTKLLISYDLRGNILFKKEITSGKKLARGEGRLWEPEGLTIKGDYLYFTINTGPKKKTIKRLYKIRVK